MQEFNGTNGIGVIKSRITTKSAATKNKERVTYFGPRKIDPEILTNKNLMKYKWVELHCNKCYFKREGGASWDFKLCSSICVDKNKHAIYLKDMENETEHGRIELHCNNCYFKRAGGVSWDYKVCSSVCVEKYNNKDSRKKLSTINKKGSKWDYKTCTKMCVKRLKKKRKK